MCPVCMCGYHLTILVDICLEIYVRIAIQIRIYSLAYIEDMALDTCVDGYNCLLFVDNINEYICIYIYIYESN